jgi:hypothetical protein
MSGATASPRDFQPAVCTEATKGSVGRLSVTVDEQRYLGRRSEMLTDAAIMTNVLVGFWTKALESWTELISGTKVPAGAVVFKR